MKFCIDCRHHKVTQQDDGYAFSYPVHSCVCPALVKPHPVNGRIYPERAQQFRDNDCGPEARHFEAKPPSRTFWQWLNRTPA